MAYNNPMTPQQQPGSDIAQIAAQLGIDPTKLNALLQSLGGGGPSAANPFSGGADIETIAKVLGIEPAALAKILQSLGSGQRSAPVERPIDSQRNRSSGSSTGEAPGPQGNLLDTMVRNAVTQRVGGAANSVAAGVKSALSNVPVIGSLFGGAAKPATAVAASTPINRAGLGAGAASLNNLAGVDTRLVAAADYAAAKTGERYYVPSGQGGVRTQAQANANARMGIGVSNSQHLVDASGVGHAVDIKTVGKDGRQGYASPAFYAAMREFGAQNGYQVRWGNTPGFLPNGGADPVHFDLGLKPPPGGEGFSLDAKPVATPAAGPAVGAGGAGTLEARQTRDLLMTGRPDLGVKPLPAAIAAGAVGNMMQESYENLRPDAIGKGGEKGIGQWMPDRYANMVAWTTANGLDPNSRAGQALFYSYELQNSPTMAKLAGLTPVDAAKLIATEFEAAGNPQMDKRIGYTNAMMMGIPVTPPPVGLGAAASHPRYGPVGGPGAFNFPAIGVSPAAAASPFSLAGSAGSAGMYGIGSPAAAASPFLAGAGSATSGPGAGIPWSSGNSGAAAFAGSGSGNPFSSAVGGGSNSGPGTPSYSYTGQGNVSVYSGQATASGNQSPSASPSYSYSGGGGGNVSVYSGSPATTNPSTTGSGYGHNADSGGGRTGDDTV